VTYNTTNTHSTAVDGFQVSNRKTAPQRRLVAQNSSNFCEVY